MTLAIKDILIQHVDEAFDADDLELFGDFVRSVIDVETQPEWYTGEMLRQLHTDLTEEFSSEKVAPRRKKLKAALSNFEAEFSDFLVNRETGALPGLSD